MGTFCFHNVSSFVLVEKNIWVLFWCRFLFWKCSTKVCIWLNMEMRRSKQNISKLVIQKNCFKYLCGKFCWYDIEQNVYSIQKIYEILQYFSQKSCLQLHIHIPNLQVWLVSVLWGFFRCDCAFIIHMLTFSS